MKLADLVNQNRLGINFTWLLVTGLPRHVHAGGVRARRDRLLPREERPARDDDQLHGLRPRHARVLRRAASRSRSAASAASASATSAGSPSSTRSGPCSIGGVDWGILGYKGFFLTGPPTTSASPRSSSSRWCSWTPRRRSRRARWPNAGSGPGSCIYCALHRRGHLPRLRELGVGRRLAVAARLARPELRRRLPRLRRKRRRPRRRRMDRARRRDGARAADRQVQQGRHRERDPGPQHHPRGARARSSSRSAGSDSTRAARSARPATATCASAWSPPYTMLAGASGSVVAMCDHVGAARQAGRRA